MPRRSSLRASDADREQVAERLRHATAEGRIEAEELEQRLGAVFAARTYGELDALVADLPRRDLARSGRRRTPSRLTNVPAPALLVLIPAAVVLVATAIAIVVTAFVFWALIVTIAWLAFGNRRPYYYPIRYRRTMRHAYGRWRA